MAFCANCGTQLSDTAASCPRCGHPTAAVAYAVGTRTEGLAITSLVLGIAGFVLCPLILHIFAIILGNQAINKIRSDPALEGEPLARAGIVLGWVGVGLAALALVGFIIALAVGAGSTRIGLGIVTRWR